MSGMGPNSTPSGPVSKPVSPSSSCMAAGWPPPSWGAARPLAKLGYLEFCPTPEASGGGSPVCDLHK